MTDETPPAPRGTEDGRRAHDGDPLAEQSRDDEDLYHALADAMDQGVCTIEMLFDERGRAVDYLILTVNRAFARQTGLTAAVGKTMRTLYPAHEAFWFETYGKIARTGVAQRFEHEAAALGRWFDVNAFRIGRPEQHRLAVVFEDITARKQTEAALRDSEERLERIVESARDYAILRVDPDGRIVDWFSGAESVFGWRAEEALGQSFHFIYTVSDRLSGVPEQEMDTARRSGLAPDRRWHCRKDGSRIYLEGTLTSLTAEDGSLSGYLKIGQDVTERHRAEERQRVLLAELQHRVRNTLGVVRAIARRTASNSRSVEEMGAHLDGRLDAFSRVQAMVTRSAYGGVDLTALVEEELLVHATREGEHLSISGPQVMLAPKSAETMSLALHELTTNAVKYGALSAGDGRVRVSWAVTGERLELHWTERGLAQPLSPPATEGFGLELLQRVVPYELQAETQVEFRPEGLRFGLSMPLKGNLVGY